MKEIEGFLHDDPKLPQKAADSIAVLGRSQAEKLWDRFIGAGRVLTKRRHFMLLSENEWPSQLTRTALSSFEWAEDWDANRHGPFRDWLRTHCDASDDSSVHILYMREHCVTTLWTTFCDHWINFLYEDEGVILLLPSRAEAFLFSNGRAWVGRRPL